MRALALATLLLLSAATAVSAQTNEVAPHYRAYSAALERGDLATAETEGQAALDASVQRDGDGGHTGVLAFNLALTRLRNGHGANAVAPAQKALEIAAAHPDAGIDPLVARLTLARAELAADAHDAPMHLRSALDDARARHDIDADIYLASVDLGAWSNSQNLFTQARNAWELAAERAGRGTQAADLARATADTGVAGAIIMDGARHGLSRRDALDALTAIQNAADVYMPLVQAPVPPEGLTSTQRGYARMYAWYLALESLVHSRGQSMPDVHSVWEGRSFDGDPTESRVPRCSMHLVAEPQPTYPLRENMMGAIGGVVVYFETDASGAIVRRQVAAAVGANLADAVEVVLPRWRLEKVTSSPPGCTMAGPHYRGVVFQIP